MIKNRKKSHYTLLYGFNQQLTIPRYRAFIQGYNKHTDY